MDELTYKVVASQSSPAKSQYWTSLVSKPTRQGHILNAECVRNKLRISTYRPASKTVTSVETRVVDPSPGRGHVVLLFTQAPS